MPVIVDRVDADSETFRANCEHSQQLLDDLGRQLDLANGGGGPRYVERHRGRGRLLARERIELLLDEDSPFFELSPLAAWGTQFQVGASVVTGVGVVEGVECVVLAHDPTVRGGAMNPFTFRKTIRALAIARENRLPFINLVESGGGDLPTQSEVFIPGGRIFKDLSQLSAAGVPTVALVFGNATAGGAYVPGMVDHVVMIREQSMVFLGGPPLVKMATGEESEEEELGGAEMHARTSGLADYLAHDEVDCIRIGRQIVSRFNRNKDHSRRRVSVPPLHDPEQLLGLAQADLKLPVDPRDILARVVDGSSFDEFKPMYGASLVTGWAHIHGWPVGILANHRGVLFNEESQKATQFIQLANQVDVPLLFLQNTTGYMVGRDYEQRGIIRDGSRMVNAVSNSRVPHLTLNIGASYGAGNYGMCGRSYGPRFLFGWPNSKSAVMGAAQLAGVLSIVSRQAAAASGREFDEDADAEMKARIEEQIESESLALFTTARLYDDGIIDPRDTRTVLGLCLSIVANVPVSADASDRFAVFR